MSAGPLVSTAFLEVRDWAIAAVAEGDEANVAAPLASRIATPAIILVSLLCLMRCIMVGIVWFYKFPDGPIVSVEQPLIAG